MYKPSGAGWDGFVGGNKCRDVAIDNIEIRYISKHITETLNFPFHLSQIIAQFTSECPNLPTYRLYLKQLITDIKQGDEYNVLMWNCPDLQRLKAVYVNKKLRNYIVFKNEKYRVDIDDYQDQMTYIHATEWCSNPTLCWKISLYKFISRFEDLVDNIPHLNRPPILFYKC
jgi:hypothetical protein